MGLHSQQAQEAVDLPAAKNCPRLWCLSPREPCKYALVAHFSKIQPKKALVARLPAQQRAFSFPFSISAISNALDLEKQSMNQPGFHIILTSSPHISPVLTYLC